MCFYVYLYTGIVHASFVEKPWCDGKCTEPLISSKRSIAVTDKWLKMKGMKFQDPQ